MDPLTRLAQVARVGDHEARESFVQALYEPVWRLCASMLDEGSADDIAQEAILRVIKALPGFRGDSSARTWVLAITRRTCMDELRARGRRRRLDDRQAQTTEHGSTTPDPAGEVALAELLARLDPDRRSAFVATQVLGLSYKEAAEVCECPSGTIRSRVARARVDLIGMLAEPDGSRRPHSDRSSLG